MFTNAKTSNPQTRAQWCSRQLSVTESTSGGRLDLALVALCRRSQSHGPQMRTTQLIGCDDNHLVFATEVERSESDHSGGACVSPVLGGGELWQWEEGTAENLKGKLPEWAKRVLKHLNWVDVCAGNEFKFNYTSIISLKGHSSLICLLNEKRATHPVQPNLCTCFGLLQTGVGWGGGGGTAPYRHIPQPGVGYTQLRMWQQTRAPGYQNPWEEVKHKALPPVLHFSSCVFGQWGT